MRTKSRGRTALLLLLLALLSPAGAWTQFDQYTAPGRPTERPGAMVLHIAGVAARGRHADQNTNWKFPDYIKGNNARIEAFMGGYAWDDLKERNNDDDADPGFLRELAWVLHRLEQDL